MTDAGAMENTIWSAKITDFLPLNDGFYQVLATKWWILEGFLNQMMDFASNTWIFWRPQVGFPAKMVDLSS